ncbi:MAG: protein-export membrane protein SecF [Candidatus Buchananbacteria bacterium RBG_13_36_9]|uniref:Protein-export membrane protein SecF n=1 Tax=Candidatus Buchananbacteria bacterium RBG_13_36_9 TaxID=1797530 RepID=A0A1G1XQS7_9BACT|nr:MAG: protein-export membrane protein SecF [Candidatus Buchananbacteria bacterium RBG_13_36_9]
MSIIKYRKIYLIFSGTLTVIAIALLLMWGLNVGIDFTGGSLMEVEYPNGRPAISELNQALGDLNLKGLKIQAIGDNGYILRFQETGEEIHQKIMDKLNPQTDNEGQPAEIKVESTSDVDVQVSGTSIDKAQTAKVIENRFESIGPSIGVELRTKAFYAVILVVISIIIYIAVAFRKVSYPVSSWKYGVAAIIALVHDVFVTIGIFVVLGKFYGFEVNAPFVAALLTILGYSVNDTIVVFDRVRENLHKYEGDFEDIVEKSIWETMARSINTIVTVELALLALLLFSGGVIKDFVLPLFIGIFFGAYSSIFIASQVLVTWQKWDWVKKKSE